MATSVTITGYPISGQNLRDSQTAIMLATLLGSGVLAIPTPVPLELSGATGMPNVNHYEVTITPNNASLTNALTIDTGLAWVGGLFVQNDASIAIDVPSNGSGNPRRDLVIIRATWGDSGGAIITTKQGATDGSSALPQYSSVPGAIYELPLAIIDVPNGATQITTVYDMRGYVSPQTPRTTSVMIAAPFADWATKANANITVPPIMPASIGAEYYINNGLNMLTAGGDLLLSEGNYPTLTPVTPGSSTILRGKGNGTVLSMASTQTGYYVIEPISGSTLVTISNLKIDGGANNAPPNTYNSGENMGGIELTACTNVTVDNCTIQNTRFNGIDMRPSGTDETGHTIKGNYLINNSNAGIMTSGCANIIQNNVIIGCQNGIYLWTAASNAYNELITGNHIRSSGNDGILVQSDTGYYLFGCEISNNEVVHSSQSNDNTHSGIVLTGANCYYNHVHGNKVYNAFNWDAYPQYGILLTGTARVNYIDDNDCICGSSDGVSSTSYSSAKNVYDVSGSFGQNGNVIRGCRIGYFNENYTHDNGPVVLGVLSSA